jgi:hypothetical protein
MGASETRRRASEHYRDARDLGAYLDPATPTAPTPAARRDAATIADVFDAASGLAQALALAARGTALVFTDALAKR